MKGWRVPAAGLLLVLACAHRQPGSETETSGAADRSPPQVSRAEERSPPAAHGAEVGLASFYARKHQGHRTASGAVYDGAALTCAHRTAPFGAQLRVTDVESGRQVVVTVNDRGPFVRGRIVDLSLAAARELGMVKRGVARVRVDRLTP